MGGMGGWISHPMVFFRAEIKLILPLQWRGYPQLVSEHSSSFPHNTFFLLSFFFISRRQLHHEGRAPGEVYPWTLIS